MSQIEKIRGVDYVTIEIYGLLQSYNASVDDCQVLVDKIQSLKHYSVKVLEHRKDTGFIDVMLTPKDQDKRKFIKNLKEDGYIE
jgi:hypothetical protein